MLRVIQILLWGCNQQLTLLLCSKIKLLEAAGKMLQGREGLPRKTPTLLVGAEGQRSGLNRLLIMMHTGLLL